MRDSKSSLKNVRVLKKNMLFIQSYDEDINKTILNSHSLYQTTGEVDKIKVKQNFKNHTAYVTYKNSQSAATAFIAFFTINQRMKILFGTVQYCKYFLRKAECRNDQCVFMHLRDKKNEIIVNDQIDEDVYLEHYDMAVKIVEDEAFQTFKKVLNKKEEGPENILKKGIRKAAQILHILPQNKQEIINLPNRKLSELQESLGSTTQDSLNYTTQDSLNQCRQEPLCSQRPASQGGRKEDLALQSLDPQASTEQCNRSALQQTKVKYFSQCEYINIQLIKKLIRENTSKMTFAEQRNEEHFQRKGNMILYKMVKQ